MLKKFMLFIMAVVVVLAFSLPSYAAKVGTFGASNSSGVAALEVDDSRVLTVSPDAGLKFSYESANTNDTLTAVDCGKTLIVTPTSQTTFILPSAVAGCEYKFIAASGDTNKKIIVDVASTDMFRGVINSAAVTTFAKGDSIISPGNTNDMVAVFSSGDTVWDVAEMRGTWADNN